MYLGFFIQGAVLLLSAELSRLGELHPDHAGAYGAAPRRHGVYLHVRFRTDGAYAGVYLSHGDLAAGDQGFRQRFPGSGLGC